jgi:hypothetical protein
MHAFVVGADETAVPSPAAEALRAAAERGVQGRVHVGQQLRAGVPSGGLGRRQLRRTQAPVQVQQAVLA